MQQLRAKSHTYIHVSLGPTALVLLCGYFFCSFFRAVSSFRIMNRLAQTYKLLLTYIRYHRIQFMPNRSNFDSMSGPTLPLAARFVATRCGYLEQLNVPAVILKILMSPFSLQALYMRNKPTSTELGRGPFPQAQHSCKACPIAGVTRVPFARHKPTSVRPVLKYNKR